MRIIDAYELVIASFIVIKVMRVKKAPDGLTIGSLEAFFYDYLVGLLEMMGAASLVVSFV